MRFNSRILLLGWVGLGSALLMGTIGWVGEQAIHHASLAQAEAAQASRSMMTADMMHDALRADVMIALRGLEQHDEKSITTAQEDVKAHSEIFEKSLNALRAIDLGPEVAGAIEKTRPILDRYSVDAAEIVTQLSSGQQVSDEHLVKFQQVFSELETSNDHLNDLVSDVVKQQTDKMADVAQTTETVQLVALITVALTMAGLSLGTIRFVRTRLGEDPEVVSAIAHRIANGDLSQELKPPTRDRANSLYSAIYSMQTQLRERITADARLAFENRQIREALDNASTGLLVADAEDRLMHANRAAVVIMERAQSELRQRWPDFTADARCRIPVELLLQGMENTEQGGSITLGEQTLRVLVTPVKNADGTPAGRVIEWRDRTAELQMENEISQIIEAAASGDLSQRIVIQQEKGFISRLARGVNRILDATTSGINDLRRVLAALAQADLTAHMSDAHQGAFGEMRDHMEDASNHLRLTLDAIRQSAGSVQQDANKITASNQDLSRRTEQQAASLEETAASIEEMTATIRQSVQNVHTANQMAQTAGDTARAGNLAVTEAVATMDEINKASSKVLDIIGVIHGIAFQTNILALNAAVEAARAGEQGRGFAVVASEVRNLAQRCSAAAREVQELITANVEQIRKGSTAVNHAGIQMGEILAAIAKVTDIMGHIAISASEQGQGIEQINSAITAIDESTRQNAAMVEEITSTASSLDERASHLRAAIQVFKLESNQTTATQIRRSTPAARIHQAA